jgi:hypothetical protein
MDSDGNMAYQIERINLMGLLVPILA